MPISTGGPRHAGWPEAWTVPVKTRHPSAHDQQTYLGDVELLLQWRKGLAGLSPGHQATESKGLGRLHGYSQMDFWARLLIGFGRVSELGARSGSPEKSTYSFHRPLWRGPPLSLSPALPSPLCLHSLCLYFSDYLHMSLPLSASLFNLIPLLPTSPSFCILFPHPHPHHILGPPGTLLVYSAPKAHL